MRVFLSAVALVLATAAPAAAAPWSPPATIVGSGDAFPALATGPAGPAAVYWSPLDARLVTFVSPLGPGLVPGPARPLTGALHLADDSVAADLPVVDARGAVVLPGTGPPTASTGAIATGPMIGPLAVGAVSAPVRGVAVNGAGDAAVVIEPCASLACPRGAPEVMVRRRGRAFGRPFAIDRPGLDYNASVAIDPRGRVLVAWDRDHRVFARFIDRRGRLGRLQALGDEVAPSVFHVVLPGDGRAAVAWGSEKFGGAGAGSPFQATLALAGPHGRFARHALETVQVPVTSEIGIPYPGVVVRLPAHAPGVVAWTGGGVNGNVVRAKTIRGTTVGVTRTLSAPGVDTVLGDAAAGSGGEAVVLTLPAAGEPGRGVVAYTRTGGTAVFGPAEPIGVATADSGDVAIDGRTGAVFVTWRSIGGDIGWSVRAPLAEATP